MDALSWVRRGPGSAVWVPAVLRGEGPLAEGGARAGTLRAKQGPRPTVPTTGVATGEGVTVVSVRRKVTGGGGSWSGGGGTQPRGATGGGGGHPPASSAGGGGCSTSVSLQGTEQHSEDPRPKKRRVPSRGGGRKKGGGGGEKGGSGGEKMRRGGRGGRKKGGGVKGTPCPLPRSVCSPPGTNSTPLPSPPHRGCPRDGAVQAALGPSPCSARRERARTGTRP